MRSSCAAGRFPLFSKFLSDQGAFERGQALDEESPVEMVDFVAEGSGQHVLAFDGYFPSRKVQALDPDPVGPGDFLGYVGDGKAALLADDRAFMVDDFRVGQDDKVVGIFAARRMPCAMLSAAPAPCT